jgi:hypothetical protein
MASDYEFNRLKDFCERLPKKKKIIEIFLDKDNRGKYVLRCLIIRVIYL